MSRRRALLRYLAARLSLAPLMLWLIASLVFLLLRLAPGDPIDALLGTRAPESARAALRAQLGLDQPCSISTAPSWASCCTAIWVPRSPIRSR